MTATGRLVESDACIAEGADWLARRDPHLARALAVTGPPPLRRKDDGFGALLDAIVSQQVSVASANAIRKRLAAAALTTPAAVIAAGEAGLRSCGLSRPKIRYALGLAAADLPYAALRTMPDDMVAARLTALPGIGQWTADIYLMLSLGRADAFAPGDLALQEAVRHLHDLPVRPTEPDLRAMAADWSPWRGVAARLLWAYYRTIRQREGI